MSDHLSTFLSRIKNIRDIDNITPEQAANLTIMMQNTDAQVLMTTDISIIIVFTNVVRPVHITTVKALFEALPDMTNIMTITAPSIDQFLRSRKLTLANLTTYMID